MKFFIVDAFTESLFGGNPAGVVLIDRESDFPTEEIMLKTAAELRYSETAFVKPKGGDLFCTRYFTPAEEVDLCGHATIGTFYALLEAGILEKGRTYKNETKAGLLDIEVSDSILMDMGAPQAIGKIEGEEELKKLYSVMGSNCGDGNRALWRQGLLPEIISTGLPDMIMPVADEKNLGEISPDFPALSRLSEEYKVVGVHAFTPMDAYGRIHCRNFAPLYAIDEEAATGTSNGALTYYLYRHGIIKAGSETVFIQGEAMNRPSKIVSRIEARGSEVKIKIGGSAVMLAKGEILL